MEKLTQPHVSPEKFSWKEFFVNETITATKLYFEPLTVFWNYVKQALRKDWKG
jgi:hypothetical protein